MIKEKLMRLLGFGTKTQDAVDTQTSVDTFSRDMRVADLRRVYSSGVITLDPRDMKIVVGKIVDVAWQLDNPLMIINCLNSDFPTSLFTCLRSPILKYSDEALTGLTKLTPMERKLLFGVYAAIPADDDLDLDTQLHFLRTNGFFSSMGLNLKRRRSDVR
jgi:hypothetical protein